MEMSKKFNITIPNVAFAWGSKYHMTDVEFMIYAHLQFMRQGGLWNQTITSIDMIIHYLGIGTSNKQRDKDKVIANLRRLEEKGYIKVDCEGDMKKDFFTVRQVQELLNKDFAVEFEEDGIKRKFMGYTKVNGEHYNLANNEGRALMTITYIIWRNNISYNVPKSEWVKVLGVAKSTFEGLFLKYKERFLQVNEGKHFINEHGQVRQETNSYEIAEEIKRHTNLKEKVQKVEKDSLLDRLLVKVTDEKVICNDEIFRQIFDKSTYIEFNGYRAWKETTCPYVKENGQKKIDAMYASQNQFAGKVADRLEREYQEHLSYQNQQQKQIERHLPDYEGEFISSYVKKPSVDFTVYLD